MLYRALKRMIERGMLENLQEKLDVFYATDRITAQEYQQLLTMLREENNAEI